MNDDNLDRMAAIFVIAVGIFVAVGTVVLVALHWTLP
jgi:hypothetical protein